jgi:hypothetical protein
MPPTRPTAFVAMKFTSEHWKDARYNAIREVLDGAGYDCLRGDEIKSSGPVVDEVCRLLREADLVVLDSSDDSHSVSYEIGYCHGVGRSPTNTLLLSRSAELPFNYRHYRNRLYKDTKSLKRSIRDFLSMSEPILDDQYGYTYSFKYSESAVYDYILDAAECIFDTIAAKNFSGRLECYSGELFFGAYRTFAVSVIGRNQVGGKTLSDEYWYDVLQKTVERLPKFAGRIELEPIGCELARKKAMKASLYYCGSAEYKDGHIVRIIDSAEGNKTFFDFYLERIDGEA